MTQLWVTHRQTASQPICKHELKHHIENMRKIFNFKQNSCVFMPIFKTSQVFFFYPPQSRKCQEFPGPVGKSKVCNRELFKKLHRTAAARMCVCSQMVLLLPGFPFMMINKDDYLITFTLTEREIKKKKRKRWHLTNTALHLSCYSAHICDIFYR